MQETYILNNAQSARNKARVLCAVGIDILPRVLTKCKLQSFIAVLLRRW